MTFSEGEVQSRTLTYLHTDHLNTPRIGTDGNEVVVWRWDSDAFGQAAPDTDPDSDGVQTVVNLRFPGQIQGGEATFYYNYFRDYDPGTGRYLQSDLLGLIDGPNTYAYVGGNPINFIDPYGLNKFDAFYGLPKKFWQWYHRNEKRPGDPDLSKEDAKDLFEEWKDMGQPGPDSKSPGSDLKSLLIPLPLELACMVDPCNPYCKPWGFECKDENMCDLEA
ncbi:RHS repeat domain-containing protein [Microbulbifer thermotolerans]|uniref:RHS repeat domain-containing protein n=1 Tax=Microbulbifer thermotolerans TaxID=252514 RepID=UPI0022495ADE|nr:RHS repeat-associated core domain-containing protein [Microbulbifer thermotolerans]MCX2833124.1 hypothetical protein [Microbulbifer thermotolerans]